MTGLRLRSVRQALAALAPNRWVKRLAGALLVLLLLAVPAAAQWQVPNHAIPLGRGNGIGFNSLAAAAAGKVLLGQGTSADPAFATMSQDCTITSAGVITCTKTNNVSFAASATTDTTSASNIGSGTLPNARLDAEVQCVAGLTSAADKIAYYTGSGTCALADFSSAMRTFLTSSSSANLRSLLSDETGTGIAYFVNGALGTPSSATLTNATGLPISTGVSGLGTGVSTALATPSSANLAAALTDETGSGAAVFGTSPTIATPVLNGTPTGTGVATAATASTLVLRDANANSSANAYIPGYATTATAAGTTTLTVASPQLQYFTGATTQTVALPVVSTLVLGQSWTIVNNSSGAVAVNSSGGNLVLSVASGNTGIFTVISTSGTTASSWSNTYISSGAGTGTVTSVTCGTGLTGGTFTTTGTCALSTPVAVANGGTGISSFASGIATWLGTSSSANLASALTDETGSGAAVFASGATLSGTTTTATVAMGDNELQSAKLKHYGETVNALGSAGGSRTIDISLGNVVTATVATSAVTWTFSNPKATGTATSFTLILTNGGSQTENWPAAVKWSAGTAPTLTSSGVDVLTFITTDGGTTWYGFLAGKGMS